jgi:hypothetical protein
MLFSSIVPLLIALPMFRVFTKQYIFGLNVTFTQFSICRVEQKKDEGINRRTNLFLAH